MKPGADSIKIYVMDVTRFSASNLHEIQEKMCYVFQEPALFDSLTILRMLRSV
jgi:ABC-type transporter Mla maintaining outer membrane lipid asymmetry ATPase subunit MlaF